MALLWRSNYFRLSDGKATDCSRFEHPESYCLMSLSTVMNWLLRVYQSHLQEGMFRERPQNREQWKKKRGVKKAQPVHQQLTTKLGQSPLC
jgi:hypothetical protein